MNKKILIPLLIVFLIFFILSFAEAQCTNDQGQIRAKPKGKIKSFTEKCYTIYQDKYLLNLKDSYFYNDNGDLLKQLSYSTFDSSTVIQTEAYVYTNRLNEYNYYHKSTKLNIKIKYQYDDKGKKIKETRNIGSVSASTTVFKYNKQGILNEEQFYTPKGKLYSIIYYNYDSLGNQAGEERRSLTSNSMIKYFYKYNDKKT